MANGKRNWENKVSSRKSTILKTASSEKGSSCEKVYTCFEKSRGP